MSSNFQQSSSSSSSSLYNLSHEYLKKYYGYSKFRPHQYEIIESILQKKDSFVLMSTGLGKSICYQLPAVLSNQITIVISPLIALMEDQVLALNSAGIKSCSINSNNSSGNKTQLEEKIKQGEFAIVFLSPEGVLNWLDNIEFLIKVSNYINSNNSNSYNYSINNNNTNPRYSGICCFAIDESHCVSEWGHDFRSAYRGLGVLRDRFPNIPILALTATATRQVQSDIISQLKLNDPFIVQTSFNRPNLTYAVRFKHNMQHDLTAETIGNGACIVYCSKRVDVETAAQHLQSIGIKASVYHAGLPSLQRTEVHKKFLRDELQVVCATIAYGMGIDKSDIRTIIHYGFVSSVESYQQQTGRAGRDGINSKCILYYDNHDYNTMLMMKLNDVKTAESRSRITRLFEGMKKFVNATECRRKILLNYFQEKFDTIHCTGCDNCDRLKQTQPTGIDITKEARIICLAIEETGRVGQSVVEGLVRGAKNGKLIEKSSRFNVPLSQSKSLGQLSHLTKAQVVSLINCLVNMGVIEQQRFQSEANKFANGNILNLSARGKKLINDNSYALEPVLPSSEMESAFKANNSSNNTDIRRSASLSQNPHQILEKKLLDELVNVRLLQAAMHRVPPYLVFNQVTLEELSHYRPTSLTTMNEISGVTQQKLEDYGSVFIDVITKFARENNMATDIKKKKIIVELDPNDPDIIFTDDDEKEIAPIQLDIESFAFKPGASQRSTSKLSSLQRISTGALLTVGGVPKSQLKNLDLNHLQPVFQPLFYAKSISNAELSVLELFQNFNKTTSEIATLRQIQENTVYNYLFECMSQGFQLDYNKLNISTELEARVNKFLNSFYSIGSNSDKTPAISEFKENFPDVELPAKCLCILAKYVRAKTPHQVINNSNTQDKHTSNTNNNNNNNNNQNSTSNSNSKSINFSRASSLVIPNQPNGVRQVAGTAFKLSSSISQPIISTKSEPIELDSAPLDEIKEQNKNNNTKKLALNSEFKPQFTSLSFAPVLSSIHFRTYRAFQIEHRSLQQMSVQFRLSEAILIQQLIDCYENGYELDEKSLFSVQITDTEEVRIFQCLRIFYNLLPSNFNVPAPTPEAIQSQISTSLNTQQIQFIRDKFLRTRENPQQLSINRSNSERNNNSSSTSDILPIRPSLRVVNSIRPDQLEHLKLFNSGKTISDIAFMKAIRTSTIAFNLSECLAAGYYLKWDQLNISKSDEESINQVIDQYYRSNPINDFNKHLLPKPEILKQNVKEEITIDTIRFVVMKYLIGKDFAVNMEEGLDQEINFTDFSHEYAPVTNSNIAISNNNKQVNSTASTKHNNNNALEPIIIDSFQSSSSGPSIQPEIYQNNQNYDLNMFIQENDELMSSPPPLERMNIFYETTPSSSASNNQANNSSVCTNTPVSNSNSVVVNLNNDLLTTSTALKRPFQSAIQEGNNNLISLFDGHEVSSDNSHKKLRIGEIVRTDSPTANSENKPGLNHPNPIQHLAEATTAMEKRDFVAVPLPKVDHEAILNELE